MRICTSCNEIKNLDEFYENKLGRYGKCSVCKVCQRKKSLAWKVRNPEKAKRSYADWVSNNRNRRYLSTYASALKCKDKIKIRQIKRRHGLNVSMDWLKTAEKSRCSICGELLVGKQWQIDHIVPRCNGGESSFSNIQIVCRTCNMMKWKLTMEEFKTQIIKICRWQFQKEDGTWPTVEEANKEPSLSFEIEA